MLAKMKRYHISHKTWFFAAVEAEAPVLSCVVMGTSDPVKNTAIGTLEYDWSIKIVHKLCR